MGQQRSKLDIEVDVDSSMLAWRLDCSATNSDMLIIGATYASKARRFLCLSPQMCVPFLLGDLVMGGHTSEARSFEPSTLPNG